MTSLAPDRTVHVPDGDDLKDAHTRRIDVIVPGPAELKDRRRKSAKTSEDTVQAPVVNEEAEDQDANHSEDGGIARRPVAADAEVQQEDGDSIALRPAAAPAAAARVNRKRPASSLSLHERQGKYGCGKCRHLVYGCESRCRKLARAGLKGYSFGPNREVLVGQEA